MHPEALIKRKQNRTQAGAARIASEPLSLRLSPIRGAAAQAGDITLVVCLRGVLRLSQATGASILPAGMTEVIDGPWSVEAMAEVDAPLWLSITGSASAWQDELGSRLHFRQRTLLPGRVRLRADDCNALSEKVRHPQATEIAAIRFVIDHVVPLQGPLHDQVDRCPGRTLEQRRRVFWRLQRVRNHLRAHCALDIGVQAGARHSGYSPSHFLRVFHRVFGETPQTFVTRQRLILARELLRASPFGVNEVGVASGFESRSAFSRQFRRQFGVSASAFRQSHLSHPVASNAISELCT